MEVIVLSIAVSIILVFFIEVFSNLLKQGKIKFYNKVLLVGIWSYIIHSFYIKRIPIGYFIGGILVFLGVRSISLFLRTNIKKKKHLKKEPIIYTDMEFDKLFLALAKKIFKIDKNLKNRKFMDEKIPYGRCNRILNHFNKSIAREDIYYFSSVKSDFLQEIIEYGVVLTSKGLYFLSEKSNRINKIEIKFSAIIEVINVGNKIKINYIFADKIKKLYISGNETTIPLKKLYRFLNEIIKDDIPFIKIEEREYLSEIKSSYGESAIKSLEALFRNDGLNDYVIEIPKDQYRKACIIVEEKTGAGELSLYAKRNIKKSAFTYEQVRGIFDSNLKEEIQLNEKEILSTKEFTGSIEEILKDVIPINLIDREALNLEELKIETKMKKISPKRLVTGYFEAENREMIQIIKEEFLSVISLFNLTKNEVEYLYILTINNKDINKVLREMYNSRKPREYAREEAIYKALIDEVLSSRNIDMEVIN